MTDIKHRVAFAAICISMLLGTLLAAGLPASAELPSVPLNDDEIHSLLEQSLSVVELDKEIGRIEEQKQVILLAMSDKERELAEGEQQIQDARDKAGEVLRSYYMGDRSNLYLALLSSRSWSQVFLIWDYLEIILSRDKQIITGYIDKYRKLESQYGELQERQTELVEVEQRLREQRDRVLALEQQLEDQLEGRSDAERIRLLMGELNRFWEEKGLAEVRTYFGALSDAMAALPAWIQERKELLEIQGFNYTIRLPEDELNAFLREQDARFGDFAFRFEDGSIAAEGEREDISIAIRGQYSIVDKPVSGIMFHVDALRFNGFALPDTTRQALEEEFDLGFYPQLIFTFLKAKSVEMKDGELIIKLSISL